MLLLRLPSRSKRVSHFRLQGFIALSCQQDHPLGDPQQDTFSYFYRENLHKNETLRANISDRFGLFDLKLRIHLCFKIIFQEEKKFRLYKNITLASRNTLKCLQLLLQLQFSIIVLDVVIVRAKITGIGN